MEHSLRLATLLLILGAAPSLAAPMLSVVDDPEPVGTIYDDPDPAGITKAIEDFHVHEGYRGNELVVISTVKPDGTVKSVIRPVIFPSPFTACGDAKDCTQTLEADCKEEGCTIKPGTTTFESGVKCAASCSCATGAVYVYHACPAPPVSPHPVRPEPQP